MYNFLDIFMVKLNGGLMATCQTPLHQRLTICLSNIVIHRLHDFDVGRHRHRHFEMSAKPTPTPTSNRHHKILVYLAYFSFFFSVKISNFLFKNKIFDAFQGLVYFYTQTDGYILHSVRQIPLKMWEILNFICLKKSEKSRFENKMSADTDTKTDMSVNH